MRADGTRILGIVLALAGLLAAPVATGCAAMDGSRSRTDAGPGEPADGSASDGGPLAPLDGALLDDGGAAIDAGSSPGFGEDFDSRGCFDFTDTDLDGHVDCSDDDCAVTPLCCVGSSAPGCCTPAVSPTVVDFSTCAGTGATGISTCFPDLTLFGSPLPDLRDFAVVPNGGDRYDSGLVLAGTVDPRLSVVHVSARIRATTAGTTCSGCIDYVGVGLVSGDTAFGSTSSVWPDAAVVVNNTRREVRLLVGDTVVRAWPFSMLPTGVDAADAIYDLVARPSGTLQLAVGGYVLVDGVAWAPAGPARLVAYGRTANPGGGDPPGASLASITVADDVCDVPASIARGDASILPERVDPWWRATDQPTGPSVVGTDMVFAFEGRIHRALATTEGRFRTVGDPHLATNAILLPSQSEAWRSTALADPELAREGDHWVIYFTAIGDGGRRVIGRAEGAPGMSWTFAAPTQLYPVGDDGFDYDGPSHLSTMIGGPHEYLAMRRRTPEGGEIVLLDLLSGSTREDAMLDPALAFTGGGPAGFVHRAGRSAGSFDADEIAAPGLVEYGGLVRLYFAGRRGTRWSIGMLASSDGVYWHLVEGGMPLLTGSGVGFDAISVSEPEPVWIGDQLRLYYTATDGVRWTIGMGHHRVAEVSP